MNINKLSFHDFGNRVKVMFGSGIWCSNIDKNKMSHVKHLLHMKMSCCAESYLLCNQYVYYTVNVFHIACTCRII